MFLSRLDHLIRPNPNRRVFGRDRTTNHSRWGDRRIMSNSFAHFGLTTSLTDALARGGVTEPFPIQTEAIPPALEGSDIQGKAPIGSGKTLAFGLPVLQ